MALTTAFLTTCRAAIALLPELTTFRASLATATSGNRAARIAAWHATFTPGLGGSSPALALRKAIRDTINAQADASGALGLLDRECAVSTLSAEYAPHIERPASDAAEAAAYQQALVQALLS